MRQEHKSAAGDRGFCIKRYQIKLTRGLKSSQNLTSGEGKLKVCPDSGKTEERSSE